MFDTPALLTALALFLVIEGLLPFVSPGGMKRALARLSTLSDRDLRIVGAGSIAVGLLLLVAVRS